MKPCVRVGLDVTWRCNWSCTHCFYRRNENLHKPVDIPLTEVFQKIDKAKAGGLSHAVMVGYGEPSLCGNMPEILEYCNKAGMATSMITDGTTGLDRFKRFFDLGMDHLHISSHGIDETLDKISERKNQFAKQAELKWWMLENGLPFRTNVTMQQLNFREILALADYEISMGVYHFVMLGFLPHYQWRGNSREVAVRPEALRSQIEHAAERLLDAGTLFTIRYHPLCHLDPKYWPYVTNTLYVFYDPWEWNYTLQVHDHEALWQASVQMNDGVAHRAEPCRSCPARQWCGGINKEFVAEFGSGCVNAVGIPDQYRHLDGVRGGLFDLNPANHHCGTIRSAP